MLLSSDLWVDALIRRAEIEGAHAVVVNKGDARAGAVIVKAYDTSTRTARLYAEAFGPDGERLWIQPVTSDSEACLLYTSPSPRDRQKSRMPSSA